MFHIIPHHHGSCRLSTVHTCAGCHGGHSSTNQRLCWPELALAEALRTEHDGPQWWWLWMIKILVKLDHRPCLSLLQICPTFNATRHENWYQPGTFEQQLHRCNLWSGCNSRWKSVLKITRNWWKSKDQTPRHFSPFWNANLHATGSLYTQCRVSAAKSNVGFVCIHLLRNGKYLTGWCIFYKIQLIQGLTPEIPYSW